MRLSSLLPLALPIGSAYAQGCQTLNSALPKTVFSPDSLEYKYESQNFWSNTEILDPGCVFRPQSGEQLAKGLKELVQSKASFAVRGGGHMGIQGANNINDGVLIVLSNLTTLELSEKKDVLSVGPAYRWTDVYNYLGPHGLAVPGGRIGPVGVPGLLLAGGVSFYGNQVGWACDSVVNYEIVLADGSLVEANKDHHSDLFWALKGGSSNFGIVTRFDVQTIHSPKVWGGTHTVAGQYIDQFLEAAATFAANISDPKTHVVPAVVPGEAVSASVILFYDSDSISYPDIFKPFTDIPSVSSTLGFKSLSEFATETAAMVIPDIKYSPSISPAIASSPANKPSDVFVAGTVTGTNHKELLDGISIINSTFFAELPKLYAEVPAANLTTIQLDWQPIGDLWMKASAERGGNPLGLDPSKVYLCYAEVVEWTGSQYDDAVAKWVENTTNKINEATKKAGLFDPFNYMGDAAGFQSIFPGYGPENHGKLQAIAKKYDPTGVFQTLMPGGFKVF